MPEPTKAPTPDPTPEQVPGPNPETPRAHGKPARGALGRRTTHGFAWLSAQTLVAKLVSTLAQIVLARLLIPEDFGVYALALTVVQFAQLLQGFGAREVLIRLHDEFDTWATPAFWMTVTGGLLAGSAVFAAAGPASVAYAEPALESILRFIAIAMPFTAMTIVSTARLEATMRYRSLALANVSITAVQFGTAITLAFLGLGVWALVFPLVGARVLTFFTLTTLARPPVRLRPEFRSWGRILKDVGTLTLAGLLTTATLQGDYIVLGLFVTSAQVGLYYIAFQLSRQPLVLIATNFSRVLLPAFTHMRNNPERQRLAYMDATASLSLVFVPICVIAASLADPIINLAFGVKYAGSVPLFAVLSLGSAFRGSTESGSALMRAQGRYASVLRLRLFLTPYFFLLLTAGILVAGVVGGAIGVGLYTLTAGLLQPAVALRPIGGGFRESFAITLPPVAIALVAGAASFSIGLLTPQTVEGRIVHLVSGAIAGAVIYIVLARVLLAPRCRIAIERLRPAIAPFGRFLPQRLLSRLPARDHNR